MPKSAAVRDSTVAPVGSSELEAKVRIQSHQLGNLCHEMRALLMVMRGYLKMVTEERSGPLTPPQREQLTVTLDRVNRLVGLSDSLLFVTNEEVQLRTVDLVKVWRGSLREVQSAATVKGLRVKENIPSESFFVAGDEQKLKSVFDGLLEKLLSVTAGGGQITAEFRHGSSGVSEQEVRINISGSGPGLPDDELEKIFERTQRTVISASGRQDTLDLPMVHDLLWLHGGRIAATSKNGESPVFVLTLPGVGKETL